MRYICNYNFDRSKILFKIFPNELETSETSRWLFYLIYLELTFWLVRKTLWKPWKMIPSIQNVPDLRSILKFQRKMKNFNKWKKIVLKILHVQLQFLLFKAKHFVFVGREQTGNSLQISAAIFKFTKFTFSKYPNTALSALCRCSDSFISAGNCLDSSMAEREGLRAILNSYL